MTLHNLLSEKGRHMGLEVAQGNECLKSNWAENEDERNSLCVCPVYTQRRKSLLRITNPRLLHPGFL